MGIPIKLVIRDTEARSPTNRDLIAMHLARLASSNGAAPTNTTASQALNSFRNPMSLSTILATAYRQILRYRPCLRYVQRLAYAGLASVTAEFLFCLAARTSSHHNQASIQSFTRDMLAKIESCKALSLFGMRVTEDFIAFAGAGGGRGTGAAGGG